jgi:hypothetical protein
METALVSVSLTAHPKLSDCRGDGDVGSMVQRRCRVLLVGGGDRRAAPLARAETRGTA